MKSRGRSRDSEENTDPGCRLGLVGVESPMRLLLALGFRFVGHDQNKEQAVAWVFPGGRHRRPVAAHVAAGMVLSVGMVFTACFPLQPNSRLIASADAWPPLATS